MSVLTSVAASGLAMALMFWARSAYQVRTLPERLMESLLLLIPPDQFEGAIERYGPAAKEYALYGAIVVMFLALVAIGVAAFRGIRHPAWLLAVGIALWLVAMVIVMPLTGAGMFAVGLFQNPLLVNAVYLGVGLSYATVLLLGRIGPVSAPVSDAPNRESRRAFVGGAAAALASFLVTLLLGKTSTQIASSLPLASVPPPAQPGPAEAPASVLEPSATVNSNGSTASSPSGSVAPSTAQVASQPSSSTPSAASPATSQPASTVAPSSAAAAPAPPPTATPAAFEYPSPPPERALQRDKDGALLAVNRPKGQLQAAVTPNDDWYTVTKNAGGDPRLEARDWRLIVDGAVSKPVQLDYVTLARLPQVTVYKTLECISNLTAKCELTAFGCDLISTAKWTGARLPDVIALAGGLKAGVAAIAAVGADEFSSALPASAATDPDVLLAYRMNDAPLPREHGFPVRLLIPDRYGMKNAKWVVNIKPMTQAYVDWYGQRNWSLQGTVNTMSRIDVPAPNAKVPAGQQQIAGIAYAGKRGITKVEFSADNGQTWQPAKLEPALGPDTFVRWSGTFQIAAGQQAVLISRATDGTGALQTSTFNLPQPNGGTGWNSITCSAA
ncbi:MAG: molybdopterin-dependent oxidoreductase [Chloroflexi bacterium]|nr:molybdopterin-dependent oxidoreductase [Chloroflexota bacterium]